MIRPTFSDSKKAPSESSSPAVSGTCIPQRNPVLRHRRVHPSGPGLLAFRMCDAHPGNQPHGQTRGNHAAALDALESGLDVRRASILLFDPDGVMRFKASRGLSDEYRAAAEGHTPWTPGTKDAEPIAVPDIADDARLAPLAETIRAEGIAAMTFIALEGTEGVLGKLMLYYAEPHSASKEELELARLIAAQVAFAVERTRAQLVAKGSEERLRFALDAANMGTWDWDVRKQQVRWSENVERIPRSAGGDVRRHVRELRPRDSSLTIGSGSSLATPRTRARGVPHDVEYRTSAPTARFDGSKGKDVSTTVRTAEPDRMTGVCMNVTPRKQAELARIEVLEHSNQTSQRLAAIVESSDDAIVSKNLDGIITSWNRRAERMFGYSASEAIGQSIILIVPPDRRDEEAHVLASIRAGRPVELETIRRRKDGTTVPISLMVSPVKDADGRIVGASKIARDITARKQSEAERAELHRRLAMLVSASASLLDSPETDSVRTATVSLAQQLMVADGYAVWATRPGGEWQILRSEGVSQGFASRVISSYRGDPALPVMAFAAPLAVTDVTREPVLQEHLATFRDEGICSLLACPMRLGAERAGSLVFYYRTPHSFSDVDVQTGQALANLAAAALTTAELYEQQRAQRNAAEYARRQAAFLADATAILSRSLDYQQTLAAVARLAVPEIADWCAVDILNETGDLHRLAVAHVDPAKLESARLLERQYPAEPSSPRGVREVIRTGQARHDGLDPGGAAGRRRPRPRTPPAADRARADVLHVRAADFLERDVRRHDLRLCRIGTALFGT